MNNKSGQQTAGGGQILPEIVLLLIVAALFVINASSFEIDPFSELFHIVSAKESLAAGRFWTPLLSGHDYLIRPPFWTWVVVACFKALGVSLWAARLPAILCALGALVLTYMLSSTLTKNRFSALFSAAVLATSWGFFQMGTFSTADMLATDLYLAFAWCLVQWHGVATRRHSLPIEMNIYSAALGLLLGVLLLVKGTLAALLLVVLGLLYLGFNQNLPAIGRLNFRYLLGLMALVPLPWLIWVSLQGHNFMFGIDYLLMQPLNRVIGAGPWQGLRMDPLFYVKQLAVGLLPYWFFIPALFLDRDPVARRGTAQAQSWFPWLIAWPLVGLVVYSLSAFQEPSLMLPFYPPVAMLVGAYLGQATETTNGTRVYNAMMSVYIVGCMMLAVFSAILVFQVLPSDYVVGFWHGPGQAVLETLKLGKHEIPLPEAFPIWKLWLIPGPFILLVGGVAMYVMQVMRRIPMATFALIATCLACLLFVKAAYLPVLHRPVAENFARALNQQVKPRDEIVLYSLHPDVKRVLFYLKTEQLAHTHIARNAAEMQRRLSEGKGTVYGIIREKSFFNDLDYSYRNFLRVNQFSWKWDMNRLWELRKLLAVRLPVFDKMKSDMLYFQSVPGNALAELQTEMLPDPADMPPGYVPAYEQLPESDESSVGGRKKRH